MARTAQELTIRGTDIEQDTVEVVEVGGVVAGFYRLRQRGSGAWLEDLFVEPALLGQGCGRRLLERACEVARSWCMTSLELVSDPNAEPFYRHLGAERVALVSSPIEAARRLPVLRLRLDPRPPT
jgi:GNAT superfamily N-acetyltransferase